MLGLRDYRTIYRDSAESVNHFTHTAKTLLEGNNGRMVRPLLPKLLIIHSVLHRS